MIYSVNYVDLAEKIDPLAFIRSLRETGWEHFPTLRTGVEIYQLENTNGFFQVNIPTERFFSDYKEAVYTSVRTVAQAEGRAEEQVLLYLLNPNTDILKIRLAKSNVEAGNILFDDAIRMYENAKKLLAAAAMDVLHPKKYHQGRMDEAVSKFVANCRFGQTEVGSYIVSVVCPFAELNSKEEYTQLSIFSDEDRCAASLTRQVTNRVMNNIDYIKQSIDDAQNDNLVSPNLNEPISANFYEALNGLNLESESTDLEFRIEWSPIVKKNRASKTHIMLTHDYYQPIGDAIIKLRDDVSKSTRIYGRIKRLESLPDAPKRKKGIITVVYLDELNRPKTVRAELSKSDYDKAIKAHAEGAIVELVGEFSGGRQRVAQCEAFEVIS